MVLGCCDPDLTDFGFEDAADVLAGLSRGNGGAFLSLGEGQTITFAGVAPNSLTAANLILSTEG